MYQRSVMLRTRRRRIPRLGNLAPPNDGTGGGLVRVNDAFSSNPFFQDMVGYAEASFPNTYDPSANGGRGAYTWNDSSFGNQTMNNVDASQQFPSGGFLPGGSGTVVAAPGGSAAVVNAPAPATSIAPIVFGVLLLGAGLLLVRKPR